MRIFGFLLSLIFISAQPLAAAETGLNYDLQAKLTQQISSDLKATFGAEDRKFLVQVYAEDIEAPAKVETQEPQTQGQVVDLGYMTYPFSTQSQNQTEKAPPLEIAKNLRYRVSIKTNSPLDKKDRQLIEETARFSMQGLTSQITVREGIFKNPEKKQDRVPSSEENKDKPENGIKEWLNQALFGVFILVLLLTSFLLRSGFMQSSENLSSGIQSLRNIKIDQKAPDAPPQKEDNDPAPLPEVSPDEAQLKLDARKLIQIIKESLEKRPRSILALAAMSQHQIGIRWLLTEMESSQIQQLQSFLGDEYFENLSQIPFDKVQVSSLKSWLREFTESLILLNMKAPGLLEEALSPQELSDALSMKAETLFNAMKAELTPGVFRLIAELSSEKDFAEISNQFSSEHWAQMIQAKDATPKDIKSALDQIQSKLGKSSAPGKSQSASSGQLQKKLLASILNKFQQLPPSEEDQFIGQIKNLHPSLYENVRAEVWLIEDLEQVPEPYLKAILAEKSAEEVFGLIMGLPQPWPEKIKSYLPEGMKKTIIMDLVQKASGQNAPNEMTAVYKICRQFMAELKSQAGKGKFRPTEKGAA